MGGRKKRRKKTVATRLCMCSACGQLTGFNRNRHEISNHLSASGMQLCKRSGMPVTKTEVEGGSLAADTATPAPIEAPTEEYPDSTKKSVRTVSGGTPGSSRRH